MLSLYSLVKKTDMDNHKLIWAYLSTRRQNLDNDYYFYENGTILHHYDRTMTKWDIDEYVTPSNIPESEKEEIIRKCETECSKAIVCQIKKLLDYE